MRALHKQLQVAERAKSQAEDDLKALSQTYAQLKVRDIILNGLSLPEEDGVCHSVVYK